MNRIIILVALALGMPMGVAQAADLDDLTMQVMESNDPSEAINEIELPEMALEAAHERDDHSGTRDELGQGLDDSINEIESEVEGEIDDSRNEVEESVEESRDAAEEVVDDSHDEVDESHHAS